MAKRAVAEGMESKTEYKASQIFDDLMLARMRSEPLLDESGVLVIPVRLESDPHFRLRGKEITLKGFLREESSPEHNIAVNELLNALNTSGRDIEFYTNSFKEKDVPKQQKLFFAKSGDYIWSKECTIRFADGSYIRSDIGGRRSSDFSPVGNRPAIIIEVIHSHLPDDATFKRLCALSQMAYTIFFYSLLSKGGGRPYFNGIYLEDGRTRVRFTYALMNGQLFRNGQLVELEGVSPTERRAEMLIKLRTLLVA